MKKVDMQDRLEENIHKTYILYTLTGIQDI